MQKTGRIEFYTPSRGFGFIRPDDGTADLFFHVSAVVEGVVLMPGHLVSMSRDRAGAGKEPSRRETCCSFDGDGTMARARDEYDLDAWSKQCDLCVKAALEAIDLSLIFSKTNQERQKPHDRQSAPRRRPSPC
jgi:cold shock protein